MALASLRKGLGSRKVRSRQDWGVTSPAANAGRHGAELCLGETFATKQQGPHLLGPKTSVARFHGAGRSDSDRLCLLTLSLRLPALCACERAAVRRQRLLQAVRSLPRLPRQASQQRAPAPALLSSPSSRDARTKQELGVSTDWVFSSWTRCQIAAGAENREDEKFGVSQLQGLVWLLESQGKPSAGRGIEAVSCL